MKNISRKTVWMAQMAILIAVIVIMTLLNIGNIPIGPIVATIYQVPVIIGAVSLGVGSGAILGAVWGLLCFFLALSGQTTDIVALAVVQDNPFLYLMIALVPRVLTGVVPGLLYKGLDRVLKGRLRVVSYGVCGVIGSLTNTVFYLGALYLFIRETLAALYGIEIGAVGAMVLGVASTNGLMEAAVSCVITLVICKALEMAGVIQKRGMK